MTDLNEFDRAQEAAEFIATSVKDQCVTFPDVAVICGSGLGGFADSLNAGATRIPYETIPHFKSSTVHGHAGEIIVGTIGEAECPIVCIAGRLHSYEGHDVKDTVFSIRVLSLLGVQTLLVTNAAGGLNQSFQVGDLMVIADHINIPGMAGLNPLKGPNDERFGERFTPLNDAYPHDLRHKLFQAAAETDIAGRVHEGVYAFVSGPNYETAAECRMLIGFGADVVGMSTVPEVLAAAHCGVRVAGLTLVTNVAIITPPIPGNIPAPKQKVEQPSHEEVLAASQQASQRVQDLVTKFVLSL